MVDEYPNISAAARNRDWRSCDRLMFGELYQLPFEGQREVSWIALSSYFLIWDGKHRDSSPSELKLIPPWEERHFPTLPHSEEPDPADAEFESGLMQFYNALSAKSLLRRTAYFATSIRSAVLARQINRWVHNFPIEYDFWKRGQYFAGPTFLEDEAASLEAEKAWSEIDELFQDLTRRQTRRRRFRFFGTEVERAYAAWSSSLL
jgi:hypothetical protein